MTDSSFAYYKLGQEDYKKGLKLDDCPYVMLSDWTLALPCWMAGWMYEKQLEKMNASKKENAS